jgi:hypothetical protein
MSDEFINKNISSESIVIDNEMYDTLRSMLSSEDIGNVSMAAEIICNSNLSESKAYILCLLNEFYKPINKHHNTPNKNNLYTYFKEYKFDTEVNKFIHSLVLKKNINNNDRFIYEKYFRLHLSSITPFKISNVNIEWDAD